MTSPRHEEEQQWKEERLQEDWPYSSASALAEGLYGPRGLVCQGGTQLVDLPDEVLQSILQAALCQAQCEQGHAEPELAAALRSVCRAWDRAFCACVGRARLADPQANAGLALCALRRCGNVRHMQLVVSPPRSGSNGGSGAALLQELAEGYPIITSFDIELERGWQALPDLAHFLSRRTGLQELRLAFTDGNRQVAAPGGDRQVAAPGGGRQTHTQMQTMMSASTSRGVLVGRAGLDFRALTLLETLTLDYQRLCFAPPEEAELAHAGSSANFISLPVSATLAELPALRALHLVAPDEGHVAQLPAWVGGLKVSVSLRLSCHGWQNPRLLLQNAGAMRSLEELDLRFGPDSAIGEAELAPLDPAAGRLPRLTALALLYGRLVGGSDAASAQETLARVIYNPCLRRLRLWCDRLPRLRAPLPLLAELTLGVFAPRAHVQRNLLALTPAVRSLELQLKEASCWPELGRHLTGLTSLTVGCGRQRGFCDVRGTRETLKELAITSCALLAAVPGLFELRPATAASLTCYCHRDSKAENGRTYGSHEEYRAGGKPCFGLEGGKARQLFRDTRGGRLPAGEEGRC